MDAKQKNQRQEILTVAHHDYERGLKAYAFFKIHDRPLSQDLVQDTFLKTWRYLVRGGKIETMKAFLYHVLNNLIIDQYRKNKTTSLDTLIEKGFEPHVESHKRLINFLDGKTAIILIGTLPIKYQKVMRMRFVQDLSLEEISLITGQTKNAVAVQIHRGLEKLRLLYSQT